MIGGSLMSTDTSPRMSAGPRSVAMGGRCSLAWAVGVAFLLALPLGPVRAEDLEAAKASVVRIVSKAPDGIERVGTGFVVKVEADLAYIATASHVVEGDPSPEIGFLATRNRPVKASIVKLEGGDPKGLALLLVRGADIPRGLQALRFAPSADVQGGQEVVVIGFGQGQGDWAVIHASIASVQGRDLRLDGRIEEGNSGGPVLRDARVVALVTGVSQGFGVATPSLIVEAVFKGWGTDVSAAPAGPSPEAQPSPTLRGGANEETRAIAEPAGRPPDSRARGIMNAHSGLCLTIAGGSTGQNVIAVQYTCDEHPSRFWSLTPAVNGTNIVLVTNLNSGLCLTIAGGGAAPNTAAVQYTCDTDPSRRWRYIRVDGGTFRLVNVNSGLCLTIAGGSTAQNVTAVQYSCDGDPSRDWRFRPTVERSR